MLLHLEICQQSRPWECGNPEGISKECGKGGKPASGLSMLSILCHFHGLLWIRVSQNHNHREGPFLGSNLTDEPDNFRVGPSSGTIAKMSVYWLGVAGALLAPAHSLSSRVGLTPSQIYFSFRATPPWLSGLNAIDLSWFSMASSPITFTRVHCSRTELCRSMVTGLELRWQTYQELCRKPPCGSWYRTDKSCLCRPR